MKRKLQYQKTNLNYNLIILSLIFFTITAFQGYSQNVNYSESYEDFMNPDRGFYYPYEGKASNFVALNYNDLVSRKNSAFEPWNANYEVRTNIILRHFILDQFRFSDISPDYLNKIQTDFNTARSAGIRMVLRFSYTITTPFCAPNQSQPDCNNGSPPAASYICLCEYGDAPKAWVLRHIAQLKPYLQNNEDVIMTVQNGFIGTWGEQYYTDYFGDASENGQGFLNATNWQDRIDVLVALLDAVPQSRMVQVRYPQMKQKFVYGVNASINSNPLSVSQAYSGLNDARIGLQNDCFLSSETDVGTYSNYDGNNPSNLLNTLRAYAAAEGAFGPVGGETCDNAYSNNNPFNNCASQGGQAVSEMETMNWSFLNADYNNLAVNNDWPTGGCMGEVKRRLGYRFVLKNGNYPSTAQVGVPVNFSLNIENVGFASPFNYRDLNIILRSVNSGAEYPFKVNGNAADSRYWFGGETIGLQGNFTISSNLPLGNYELLLQLTDNTSSPDWAIQFANNGVWELGTGFNKLNHTITVQQSTNPQPDNDCVAVDGNANDWSSIDALSEVFSGSLSSLKVADDAQDLFILLEGGLDINNQIFIDTDNNNSGANEYRASNWGNSGFNYMIENGSLFLYTGDGFSWSWSPAGSVVYQSSSTVLEMSVGKNQLGSLSSTIKVAANSLNNSWSQTGYVPAGSSGANYALFSNSPCSSLADCIVVDGNTNDWQSVATASQNSSGNLNTLKVSDSGDNLYILIQGNPDANIQVFIDTDNEAQGSNEYMASNWGSTGFNYMIENNGLYLYNGDGFGWQWAPLGGILFQKSGSALEFSIPKSSLGNLASSIRIGANSVNSNWSQTGVIPTGSVGTSHTLTSQPCTNTNVSFREIPLTTKVQVNTFRASGSDCLTVDGNENDWQNISPYAQAPTGSLTHIKVADDEETIYFYFEGGLDINNQVLIDTDNDATGNDEFILSKWQSTGFNYLIENTNLFKYNGDGEEWMWSPIGTVNLITSNNVLEVSVQKSQLNNLATTIGVAANSLDADYKETGAIPTSNAGTNYLLLSNNPCISTPACKTIDGNANDWQDIAITAQASSGVLTELKIADDANNLYLTIAGSPDVSNEILFDTDNDATGTNEYTGSYWASTGFNYMIENGDLFLYDGDGISWSWMPLGAINVVISNNAIELSIPKVQLENLVSSINVAALSLSTDWVETGNIPTATTAANYVLLSNNPCGNDSNNFEALDEAIQIHEDAENNLVYITGKLDLVNITVLDANENVVLNPATENNTLTIDFSNLNNGLYFLNIQHVDYPKVRTKTILKQ